MKQCNHPPVYRHRVSSEILSHIQQYLSDRGLLNMSSVYILGQQLGMPSRSYQVCAKCGRAKASGQSMKPAIRLITLPNSLSAMKEMGALTSKLQEALEILEQKMADDSGENRTTLTTIKAFVVPALRSARALEGNDAAS